MAGYNAVEHGVFQAQINGTYYEVGEGAFTYDFLDMTRTMQGGSNHSTVVKKQNTMQGVIFKGTGFDYKKLTTSKDITFQARLLSGKTVQLNHCNWVGEAPDDCQSATFNFSFSAGAGNGKII